MEIRLLLLGYVEAERTTKRTGHSPDDDGGAGGSDRVSSLIVQTYREYKHFKDREIRIEAKMAQARKEFEQKEAYLAQLLEDPEFLERVARERLGYSRPDEVLFRFSDEP